jgi:hypothetical protein
VLPRDPHLVKARPSKDGVSRRGLLGGLGAGAGLLALAGCGGDEPRKAPPPQPTPEENDAILLNRILEVELALVAAYELGDDLLEGATRRQSRLLLGHEREHAEVLTRTVQRLGGSPKRPRSREDYLSQFPAPKRPEDVLRFAVDLENKVIKAYGDSVGRLRFARHRQLAASIMAGEAEHTAVLLGLLEPGDAAAQLPEAFVTGVASAT